MMHYQVRTLRSEDFVVLGQLEAEIFGSAGYAPLCPYYLRLCTEFYPDTSFLALAGDRPIAYLLAFVREREAYCPRLGVRREFQGTSAATQVIMALLTTLVARGVDLCWFTVKPENTHARALYRRLGATERGTRRDFFATGDELLVQDLDVRCGLERLRQGLRARAG